MALQDQRLLRRLSILGGLFFLGLGGLLPTAQASVQGHGLSLTIQPLLQQAPDQISIVTRTQDRWVIADGSSKVRTYDLDSFAPLAEGKGGRSNPNMDSLPNGWTALCANHGTQLIVFRAQTPNDQHVIDFPSASGITCYAVALQSGANGLPQAWIGNLGSRQVLLLDPFTGKILRTFSGISGPAHFQLVNGLLFSLNELLYPDYGLPYVFEAATGKTVVGDPLGREEKTSMTRGYSFAIYFDAPRDRVYYLRSLDRELHSFPATQPTEASLTKHPLQVQPPTSIGRFGKCLAVLGQTLDPEQRPQWEILDDSFRQLRLTEIIDDPSIRGSLRQIVDSKGNVIVSHWKGVSIVRGLFDGLDCNRLPN